MILQYPALLSGVPFISVVCAVQVLIPLRWVAPHLVRPPEERFVLDSIYNFVHQLFEHHIHSFNLRFWFLHPEVLFWSCWKNALPKSIEQRGLTPILQSIIFETLILTPQYAS